MLTNFNLFRYSTIWVVVLKNIMQHYRRNITNCTSNDFKEVKTEFLNPSSFISSTVVAQCYNINILN